MHRWLAHLGQPNAPTHQQNETKDQSTSRPVELDSWGQFERVVNDEKRPRPMLIGMIPFTIQACFNMCSSSSSAKRLSYSMSRQAGGSSFFSECIAAAQRLASKRAMQLVAERWRQQQRADSAAGACVCSDPRPSGDDEAPAGGDRPEGRLVPPSCATGTPDQSIGTAFDGEHHRLFLLLVLSRSVPRSLAPLTITRRRGYVAGAWERTRCPGDAV
jgi:hypothetical protein